MITWCLTLLSALVASVGCGEVFTHLLSIFTAIATFNNARSQSWFAPFLFFHLHVNDKAVDRITVNNYFFFMLLCFCSQVWEENYTRTSAWIMSLKVIWIPRNKQNRLNKSSLKFIGFILPPPALKETSLQCMTAVSYLQEWIRDRNHPQALIPGKPEKQLLIKLFIG